MITGVHVHADDSSHIRVVYPDVKNGCIEIIDGTGTATVRLFPQSDPNSAIYFLLALERAANELRLMVEAKR